MLLEVASSWKLLRILLFLRIQVIFVPELSLLMMFHTVLTDHNLEYIDCSLDICAKLRDEPN